MSMRRKSPNADTGRRTKGIYAETVFAFGLRRRPLGARENTPQLSLAYKLSEHINRPQTIGKNGGGWCRLFVCIEFWGNARSLRRICI